MARPDLDDKDREIHVRLDVAFAEKPLQIVPAHRSSECTEIPRWRSMHACEASSRCGRRARLRRTGWPRKGRVLKLRRSDAQLDLLLFGIVLQHESTGVLARSYWSYAAAEADASLPRGADSASAVWRARLHGGALPAPAVVASPPRLLPAARSAHTHTHTQLPTISHAQYSFVRVKTRMRASSLPVARGTVHLAL